MPLQNPTKKHHQAALLLAEDELTDEQIALQVGVHRTTLASWKKEPVFVALIEEQLAKLNADMLKLPIAKRRERLKKLNSLEEKLFTVIDARAADMAKIPGGETGLLVRQVKQIGSGKDVQVIEEYVVDAGMIREIRALQDQAAGEIGQKVEKVAINGEMVVRRYIGVSPEDV